MATCILLITTKGVVGYGALIDILYSFEWCNFKFASHPLRTTGGSTPVSCDLNTVSVTTTTTWRDFKVTVLTQYAKTPKKYSHAEEVGHD